MENFENEQLRYEPARQIPVEPEMPACPSEPAQETVFYQPEAAAYRPEPAQETVHQHTQGTVYHQPEQPYHGAGAGRKESPFANSPYVTNHQSADPYRYEDTYVPPVPPREPPRKVKKAKKNGGKVWKTILCTILILALVAGSCAGTAYVLNSRWESKTDTMVASFEKRLDEMQAQLDAADSVPSTITVNPDSVIYMTAPGAVYEKNVRSVVMITATVKSSIYGQTATGISSGSGFVLTADGYVVTNHHVVDGATSVAVTMYDGVEYAAKLIGSDATNDVALLKITDSVNLQPVSIGSSDALRVGDQVVAIGNPLGELTSTLTVGYVSAKERKVTTDGTTINMIQTDAAINSGNSGGPLFNMNGEVVGITTAKYSGASSSGATIEGIGFAIPIDDVMPLVSDLKQYGYINSAYLGVLVSDMDPAVAAYGFPMGAYVQEVTAGSCADAAGVRAKDIIVGLGSHKVESLSDLTKALRKFKAGDTTVITVFRNGEKLNLTITLDEKPRDTQQTQPNDTPSEGDYDEWFNFFFGDQG